MTSAIETVVYPDGSAYNVDRGPIAALNARKVELPSVTKTTAAELMRAMEDGFSIAGRLHAKTLLEATRATGAADRRAAVVMLDIAPTVLREKGLTKPGSPGGNEDQRKAVLTTDELHTKLKDCVDQLDAIVALLKIDMRGFEMCFTAIKRAVDTNFQLPAMVSTDHTQAHREREIERRQWTPPPTYGNQPEAKPAPTSRSAPNNDFGIEIGEANY